MGQTLEPYSEGEFAVATTRFELAAEYAGLGDNAIGNMMIGTVGDDSYISSRLHATTDFGVVTVRVPQNPSMYGPRAGTVFPVVYYVSYPTTTNNPREDYEFPYTNTNDYTFPRMQDEGEEPLFADASDQYPLVLISHGYRAHGLWDLGHAKTLASHGYISTAIFYGDGRFPIDNRTLYQFHLRPLITIAVLDDLLQSAFGAYIDQSRIGIVGNSFGGMTTFALLGGDIGNNSNSLEDPRIKVGVGVVPFLGSGTLFPFGSSNIGARGVDKPLLSIYATSDTVAPPSYLLAALRRTVGTTYAVSLGGAPHILRPNENVDAINWELLFFNAYLKGDYRSLSALNTVQSFQGAANDQQEFAYQRIVAGPALTLDQAFGEGAASNFPRVHLVGGEEQPQLVLSFPRLIDSSGIVYELQASTDGLQWDYVESSELAPVLPQMSGFPIGGAYELAALKDAAWPVPNNEPRLLRVRARRF